MWNENHSTHSSGTYWQQTLTTFTKKHFQNPQVVSRIPSHLQTWYVDRFVTPTLPWWSWRGAREHNTQPGLARTAELRNRALVKCGVMDTHILWPYTVFSRIIFLRSSSSSACTTSSSCVYIKVWICVHFKFALYSLHITKAKQHFRILKELIFVSGLLTFFNIKIHQNISECNVINSFFPLCTQSRTATSLWLPQPCI